MNEWDSYEYQRRIVQREMNSPPYITEKISFEIFEKTDEERAKLLTYKHRWKHDRLQQHTKRRAGNNKPS